MARIGEPLAHLTRVQLRDVRLRQLRGQLIQRGVSWAHNRDAPKRRRRREEATLQGRHQPGPHQRRLATPRRTHHGQKPAVRQPVQQLLRLLLAAIKQIALAGFKSSESGVGPGGRRCHGRPARTCSRNGANCAGPKSAPRSITGTNRENVPVWPGGRMQLLAVSATDSSIRLGHSHPSGA